MANAKAPVLNKNLTKPAVQAFYGTSGYRLTAPHLNNVVCRASIIAYIRSSTFAGKYIGVYITASHNPVEYNGIKFVDFNGNILAGSWEDASDELVNCDDMDFNLVINKIFRQNSNFKDMSDAIIGNVVLGRDNRESGIQLTENIKEVLKAYKCHVYDYGIVSCPEMHFLIRQSNDNNKIVDKSIYINHLYSSFVKLKGVTGTELGFGIDTANGVGGIKINELFEKDKSIQLEILNDPSNNGGLNHECGADFVKVNEKVPKLNPSKYRQCGSFDGDVDRLIIYTKESLILDGDAQCVFVAELIKRELIRENIVSDIVIVLGQYSNTGAVNYLQENGFRVVFVHTGVKNFVKEAKKHDIGIYFETNGHGSVIFSKRFLDKISDVSEASILKILTQMFDPCVGDALANLLIFKATLSSLGDLTKYNKEFTRLLSVKVRDKMAVKVNKEGYVLEPLVQKKIDEFIIRFNGRVFVRPSGTENAVRVFAECSRSMDCDRLAVNVAQVIYDNFDGVGEFPEIRYHDY